MTLEEVIARAEADRARAAIDPALRDKIDMNLPIPRPFKESDDIRYVILGQDPTVDPPNRRQTITTVLDLNNKSGPLRQYVKTICSGLGVELDAIYATNLCKWFFTAPPTKKENRKNLGIPALIRSAEYGKDLLKDELSNFPNAKIISLGEPNLAVLVQDGRSKWMREYWGRRGEWTPENAKLQPPLRIEALDGNLGRVIFPFPHQPSQRGRAGDFYKPNFSRYLDFIRSSPVDK